MKSSSTQLTSLSTPFQPASQSFLHLAMSELTEGVYAIHHVISDTPEGPRYATSAGTNKPVKAEPQGIYLDDNNRVRSIEGPLNLLF